MRLKHALVMAFTLSICFSGAAAGDWPNWRGPNLDGISTETNWDPYALNDVKIAWQAEIGIGYSSVSVADGKAYTMGNVNRDTDVIYCFDAVSGEELWRYTYDEPLDPKYYEGGPSATPTVHDGKVYTLSKSGKVFCLDAATGEVIWHRKLPHQEGLGRVLPAKRPTWGFASSGLIFDDMIIFNVGSAGVALDKNDGSIIWHSNRGESGYATPVPFTAADGSTQLALFGKDSLMAIDPNDGQVLWSYPWQTRYDVNAADPMIVGDEIFITSGYNRGATLLKMNATPTPIWENRTMRSQMSGPVLIGDYLYGIDQNQMACVRWDTGEQLWTERSVGNGTLSAAGDKLIVLSERGRLMIVEACPNGFNELSGADVLSARCWSPPTLSNGLIYARNSRGTLVAVDVRDEHMQSLVVMGEPDQHDWPQWRGPRRDGKSRETGLLTDWPEDGPAMLWSAEGLGEGFSTVAIADERIYTTGMFGRQGRLICLDMNGNALWQADYGEEWRGSYSGTRSTPTVHDGSVYVISGVGQVAAFDAATGENRWQVDALEQHNGRHGSWGVAESPLIVNNKVIFTVGSQDAMLVALDTGTGQTVWTTPGKGRTAAYCSPLAVEWAGKTLIIGMVDDYIFVVDAADGALQWSYAVTNYIRRNRSIHPNTPVFKDGRFFVSSGYNMGGIQFEISEDGQTITETWRTDVMDTHHGGFILHDGYLYGTSWDGNNNGNWVCLDWMTGDVHYDTNWHTKGSMTFAAGMLYCYEDRDGHLGLVPATPDGFNVISSFVIEHGDGRHWSHPVIFEKRLYMRRGDEMAVYDIAAR